MERHTGLAGESSPKPPKAKDWRPALEQKTQGMLYSFGASSALARKSNAVKMGEAYRDRAIVSRDGNNTANIGQGYYMKAMSPGADFDASYIEEARKKRVETLQHTLWRSGKLELVAQEDHVAGTRPVEESEKKGLDELRLLRNYVAPRRATALRTIETVDPVEHLAQPADSSQLLRTTQEIHPNSLVPGSPHTIAPIAAASALAEREEHPPRQDGVSGWETGDSDASTAKSASNAAIWRCQSKYDDSAEEEEKPKQRNRGRRSLNGPTGTLSELEKWRQASSPGPEEESGRKDSGLAGLEETPQGGAREKGKAKPPAADRSSAPSSLLDSVPVPDERRRRPTKKHTPKQRTARWPSFLHEGPASESAVLEPAQRTRRLTAAEKGKAPAECDCPACQPQLHRRVRFDDNAMEKAEERPGLSHEGFVKMMRENRRRLEALARGEGMSSWETDGTMGPVGLDMFQNPRPAPRVPGRLQESANVMQGEGAQRRRVNKHEIGVPMGRFIVSSRVHEFPSPGSRARSRVTHPVEADLMLAVQTDGSSRHPIWRALSKRFRR